MSPTAFSPHPPVSEKVTACSDPHRQPRALGPSVSEALPIQNAGGFESVPREDLEARLFSGPWCMISVWLKTIRCEQHGAQSRGSVFLA